MGEDEDGEGSPRASVGIGAVGGERPERQMQEDALFNQWVQDIRSELVTMKGRTEAEKQLYNETLNRAILGYEEDRGKLLAIIHDLVSKRRLSDVPPRTSGYTTLPEAIFAEIIGLKRP